MRSLTRHGGVRGGIMDNIIWSKDYIEDKFSITIVSEKNEKNERNENQPNQVSSPCEQPV